MAERREGAKRPTSLEVKDFRRLQHYRDRDPIWIKLYTNVLIDTKFLQLPEAGQAQLVKLWILASQLGNPLPYNPKLLSGKVGAQGKFYLPEIIAAGFLIPRQESASSSGNESLADPEESASRTLPPDGAEESASGSVRGRARSRESDSESGELEREEPLSPPRVNVVLCAAANRGLAEHPDRPQPIPRVLPNSGRTLEAVEEIMRADVPLAFAETAVYDVARSHRADGEINSLKYFVQPVLRRWQEHGAGEAASHSNGASNGVQSVRRKAAATSPAGAQGYANALKGIEDL